MKSYSLTVGRLYILPSIKLAFHYIYFCQKMSHICLKSETPCSIWCICSDFFRRIRKPSLGHHDTTCKAGKDDMQVCGFHHHRDKILNVDRVSFESHQRCLLPSPAQSVHRDCPTGIEGLGGQGFWAAVRVQDARDTDEGFGSMT